MNQHLTHPATIVDVCLSRRLAMHNREIEGEPGNWPNWHTVRDENDGNVHLSCGQIEGDAVGITMARHQRQLEIAARENFEIALVVTDEFNCAQDFEEFITAMQPANQSKKSSRPEMLSECFQRLRRGKR